MEETYMLKYLTKFWLILDKCLAGFIHFWESLCDIPTKENQEFKYWVLNMCVYAQMILSLLKLTAVFEEHFRQT